MVSRHPMEGKPLSSWRRYAQPRCLHSRVWAERRSGTKIPETKALIDGIISNVPWRVRTYAGSMRGSWWLPIAQLRGISPQESLQEPE